MGKSYILVPKGGHLGLFLPSIRKNSIQMDCRDKIQLKKLCFQFINLYRSFTFSPVSFIAGDDKGPGEGPA